MKNVRIALTSPNYFKASAWVIKKRLGTNYCHACIISYDSQFDVYDVSQAAHGMVHEMDLEIFSSKNDFVKIFFIELTDKQFIKGKTWLKKQRGKGYSEAGAIASTFRFLRKVGIGADGDKEFICSEFAFRFLEEALGVELIAEGRGKDDYVDPRVLEGVLLEIQNRQMQLQAGVDNAQH